MFNGDDCFIISSIKNSPNGASMSRCDATFCAQTIDYVTVRSPRYSGWLQIWSLMHQRVGGVCSLVSILSEFYNVPSINWMLHTTVRFAQWLLTSLMRFQSTLGYVKFDIGHCVLWSLSQLLFTENFPIIHSFTIVDTYVRKSQILAGSVVGSQPFIFFS